MTIHNYSIGGETLMWEEVQKFTFDRDAFSWNDSRDLNRMYLESNLNYANHKLVARGFIFLNEILESIGIRRTGLGQLLGWTRDNGQGVINCEMTPIEDGYELIFTVDGIIWDKIDMLQEVMP